MKKSVSILTAFYGWLLIFYPHDFREEFAEEMLLDFADMLESASKGDIFSSFLIIIREVRDFPFSLLSAHLKENQMSTMFRSDLARNVMRGAFAIGLAYATFYTMASLIVSVMEDWGWIFLLQITNSQGWHLNYNSTASTILYFSSLTLGSLLAGIFLALYFWETQRIGRYLLASLLGWVAPLAFLQIAGAFLKDNQSVLINSIISQGGIIIIGLGFGVMFSMILRNRKKTSWLLLVGVIGYLLARSMAMLFLPLAPDNNAGLFDWNEIAFVAIIFGLEGAIMGALLGAVSGWSKRKATLIGVI